MKSIYFFSMIILLAFANNYSNQLIDVTLIDPTIKIELPYATECNFTNQKVYPNCARAYLLNCVAQKLKEANEEFKKHGVCLKIWDAFRPFPAQEKFWHICPDERYVSNPAKGGGRHTRGTTVDVTLIDLATGQEIEMPTAFDDFSERAHSNFDGCSESAKKNRELLKSVMLKHGFQVIDTEWWHFDYCAWKDFPVIMTSFEELAAQKVS